MAKYTVDGFVRIKMTVEADSEDEAIEMAAESFDMEQHIDKEAEPEWEVANEVTPELEDEDEDAPLRVSTVRFNEEDEDHDD